MYYTFSFTNSEGETERGGVDIIPGITPWETIDDFLVQLQHGTPGMSNLHVNLDGPTRPEAIPPSLQPAVEEIYGTVEAGLSAVIEHGNVIHLETEQPRNQPLPGTFNKHESEIVYARKLIESGHLKELLQKLGVATIGEAKTKLLHAGLTETEVNFIFAESDLRPELISSGAYPEEQPSREQPSMLPFVLAGVAVLLLFWRK